MDRTLQIYMINTRIGHANKLSTRSSTNATNGCAIVETKYVELIMKSSKVFSTKNLALKNQITEQLRHTYNASLLLQTDQCSQYLVILPKAQAIVMVEISVRVTIHEF